MHMSQDKEGVVIDGDVDNTPVWRLLLNNTCTASGVVFFGFFFFHLSSSASRQRTDKRLRGDRTRTVDLNWPKGYSMP